MSEEQAKYETCPHIEYALAVDPAYGKPSAYAVIDVEKEEPMFMGDFKDCAQIGNIIHRNGGIVRSVFVEGQYIAYKSNHGHKTVVNAKTLIELSRKAGEIIGYCRSFGLDHYEYINPLDWLQAFFRRTRVPAHKNAMKAVVKLTVNRWQLQNLGNRQVTEDICCAINIGLHGVRRLKSDRRFKLNG